MGHQFFWYHVISSNQSNLLNLFDLLFNCCSSRFCLSQSTWKKLTVLFFMRPTVVQYLLVLYIIHCSFHFKSYRCCPSQQRFVGVGIWRKENITLNSSIVSSFDSIRFKELIVLWLARRKENTRTVYPLISFLCPTGPERVWVKLHKLEVTAVDSQRPVFSLPIVSNLFFSFFNNFTTPSTQVLIRKFHPQVGI